MSAVAPGAPADPGHDGPEPVEIPLPGGMGSGGAVVRVADTVRRPLRPQSPAVHAFLDHVARQGFTGAPRFLGIDNSGREVLSYLEGDVGVPPFPDWVGDEALLDSVAVLQRDLHRAAEGFVVPAGASWDRANLPEAGPGAIVCHNDLCVENIVVRDGRAFGVIDFDFAAPIDRRYDIAIAARHWAPIRDPQDLDEARREVDQIGRFRRFCELHALPTADRVAVVGMLGEFLDRALVSMRLRAEAGNPMYQQAWAAGYPDQNRRARSFLDRCADRLA